MSRPRVAVVVAAYQAERTLPACLAAIAAQDADVELETIVVDDGSTDGTARVATEAGARVVSQENAGPAAARNRGWRTSEAEIVAFTDSDCVPHRSWIRRLTGALDDGHAVACGTYGIANPGRLLAEAVHAEIVWRHARLGKRVDFAGSFNLAVRRPALEKVGGFDESFRSASAEDNDLSYRLRDVGYRIAFEPRAVVDHHHPVSLRTYLREQARHGLWRVILYARHPGRSRGDDYAGWPDLASPPLAALSVALLAASPWWRPAPGLALLALVAVLVIHSRLALAVATHCRSTVPLALLPVASLRAYARAWGMLRGFLRVLSGRGR